MKTPFPKELRRLGVIAPASRCDQKKLAAGLKLFRSFGIEPVLPREGLFAPVREEYLAAPDAHRAQTLNEMIRDDSIDAIICVRGGYGSPRILPMIDWKTFQQRPDLPLIGFSDITALHFAMLAKKAGIPVAGQMAAKFPVSMEDQATYQSMKRALNVAFHGKNELKKCGRKLQVLHHGSEVSAPIITANLSLAAALCGTPYMPDFTDKIIVLEEIGERVRIIDRMLHQLLMSGVFERATALVFGEFTECPDPRKRSFMLKEFAQKVSIPVYAGLAFGHEIPSISIVCGEQCAIDPEGVIML